MIKLILNASSFEKAVAVGLGASLDDVLRENLFLTSTKVGVREHAKPGEIFEIVGVGRRNFFAHIAAKRNKSGKIE